MSMIERPAKRAVPSAGAPAVVCACQWRSTVLVTYSMIENITGRRTSCGQRRVSKTTSGLSAGAGAGGGGRGGGVARPPPPPRGGGGGGGRPGGALGAAPPGGGGP